MLTTSAPSLLRPGQAVSWTCRSLRKPTTTASTTSAPFLLRYPSYLSTAALFSMQSRTVVTAVPLQRKLAILQPSLRRCASSSSSTSAPLRTSSQTGASINRDAAADAAAAAAIADRTKTAFETRSGSGSAAALDPRPLDWNTFFALRKTRRRIQVAFSVACGVIGGIGGGLILSNGVAEPLLMQVPLDPFLTLGLMTIGFSALGWLAGPSVGNVVFYAWKRQYKTQMTIKETQFFARIKRNRVDPSASSAGNPVPDFYGEKISSVAGYRQWLKDQRAFNKKRTTFI